MFYVFIRWKKSVEKNVFEEKNENRKTVQFSSNGQRDN